PLTWLSRSTDIGLDNLQVLAPSLAQAQAQAARIERLPEVARVVTLASLVPDGQPDKLARIGALSTLLTPVLAQPPLAPATDAARVASLRAAAISLRNAA